MHQNTQESITLHSLWGVLPIPMPASVQARFNLFVGNTRCLPGATNSNPGYIACLLRITAANSDSILVGPNKAVMVHLKSQEASVTMEVGL
jgi:hypothetical protein